MSEDLQIDALAKVNAQNIVNKLKAGGVLTANQQKTLDEFRSAKTGGEWVKDLSALAKELGLSRQSIYNARAHHLDAPAKHEDGRRENLPAWQKFCADNLIGKDTATKNLADLKAQLMQREITLRDMKIAREAGDTIAKDVVEEMLVTLGRKLDLLLRLKLEVELGQRVVGKNAAEANMEGSIMLEEIREVINANISQFESEALAQSRKAENQS